MSGNVWSFLRGDEISSSREEVASQNRLAIRYFASVGLPIGVANLATQLVVGGVDSFSWNLLWLPLYFAALVVVDRLLLPMDSKNSTLLIYALCAPVLLVSILLGTVWDPTHAAVTYLMFMLVLPVFVLDKPLRLGAVMLGWSALFAALCVAFKEPQVVHGDLLHLLQFQLFSLAVTGMVLRLRLLAIQSLVATRYSLEHDGVSGVQNERCLERRLGGYTNRRLFVSLVSLDNLSFVNDFYGREVGNAVVLAFARILEDEFGEKNVYHLSGDGFLCVGPCYEEEVGAARLDALRERVRATKVEGVYTRLSCTIGYVTGMPEEPVDVRSMTQLAEINLHRAVRSGLDQVFGGAFDEAALEAGVAESTNALHAQAYEINQLTGLPSMTYFTARADELLAQMHGIDRAPVVGFFNVVGFRGLNEELGFEFGDDLIRFVAKGLRMELPNRLLTYITGSQFATLCFADEVDRVMGSMAGRLGTYRAGRPVELKAGFATLRPGESTISLLDKAMLAHASIVDRKGVLYRTYDRELDEQLRFNKYLVSHLDRAIEEGWLKVYYQPIVRARDGVECNREALSRWVDPTYGFLPPLQFIGVLERERLVYKLSLHVVRQVLADFAWLRERGLPIVPVSINLSRADFLECDMVSEISALVDASGFSRKLISIEITESAFVDSLDLLKREVARFREAGFAVWMDDFGSEYSTLNLLQELDFDLVKLDMQFMRNFSATGRNGIIVSDVIDMCRRLGMTTLVEGVEEREQQELLNAMGSDKLQGYLFSRPRELAELVGEGA